MTHAVNEETALRNALCTLGTWLRSQHYKFTTVTPATHAAVLANRPRAIAENLRDVFGWNLPFQRSLMPAPVLDALEEAHLLDPSESGLVRAKVRFSTIGGHLFPHSPYPTVENDAVFFGPDTYRFASLVERELTARPLHPGARVLDTCCGSGAGGVVAATLQPTLKPVLTLSDISPSALPFAQVSAQLAGLSNVRFALGDLFHAVHGVFDFIMANPPYLNDSTMRMYRHGGGKWGGGLSERIVREGITRLAPGGRLVLYTGTAITHGVDHLHSALRAHLETSGCEWNYEEIDPDVFGEELGNPAYADVERIAVVGLVVGKP